MNGFVINITRKGVPLDLYAEQANPLPDADGYIPYLIRGDWQTARVYIHVDRCLLINPNRASEAKNYKTAHHPQQVIAYSHDAWLPAHEVQAIGEAIGERLRSKKQRTSRTF